MEKSTPTAIAFGSLQWFFFIFANTIVVPISVGAAFELPQPAIMGMIRSSLAFTGIACMLQGWIGHRFPVMEGHSGVTWGLVLNLCLSASSLGMSLPDIGGGIATGMLLAGASTVLLGSFGLLSFLQRVFTPMVMTVFLFLLTFQLALIFFGGMFRFAPDGSLDTRAALFAIGVAVLTALVKIKAKPAVGNFSILIGILAGWLLHLALFPSAAEAGSAAGASFEWFPLGHPNANIGIIAATFAASFVNLSNVVASVKTASELLGEEANQRRINRGYILTGAYSAGGALFGLVSHAPFASSVGFLESTRIFDRRPFLIGGGMMAVLGLVPLFYQALSTLPVHVGNAVLFVAYMQLFGTAMRSLKGYEFNSVTIHRLAVPVLVGIAIMFADPALFEALPAVLAPLLSNGFIVGVLLSIVLELTVRWK